MEGQMEMEMAFMAGQMEERGEICVPGWDELYEIITEASQRYYGENGYAPMLMEKEANAIAHDLFLEKFGSGNEQRAKQRI